MISRDCESAAFAKMDKQVQRKAGKRVLVANSFQHVGYLDEDMPCTCAYLTRL